VNCLLASVTSYLQRAPDVTVFGDDREKFNVFAYYCQASELYIYYLTASLRSSIFLSVSNSYSIIITKPATRFVGQMLVGA